MNYLRFTTLSTLFVLMCANVGHAVEFNVTGSFDITLQGMSDVNFMHSNAVNSTWDEFAAGQNIKLNLDVMASEYLYGSIGLQAGTTTWGYPGVFGSRSQGGDLNNDVPVILKRAFIDFFIPDTDVEVRAGLQDFTLPSLAGLGSAMLDNSGAGISVSAQLTDTIDVELFWLRAFDGDYILSPSGNNFSHNGSADFFGLAVPMHFDFAHISPWFMYGRISENSIDSYLNNINNLSTYYPPLADWAGDNVYGYTGYLDSMLPAIMPLNSLGQFDAPSGNAFFGGIVAEMDNFDRITIGIDANYGSSGLDGAWGREGFFLSAIAEYSFDWGIPGIYGWYASGDNSNVADGSERMASVSPLWGNTGLGYSGQYSISYGNAINISPAGTWGVALQVNNLELFRMIEGLSHRIVLAYYGGTNDEMMAAYITGRAVLPSSYTSLYSGGNQVGITPFSYLTTEDSAIELTFNTTYDLYRDLQSNLEFSYIWQNFDENTWSTATTRPDFKNAWKLALNMRYSF